MTLGDDTTIGIRIADTHDALITLRVPTHVARRNGIAIGVRAGASLLADAIHLMPWRDAAERRPPRQGVRELAAPGPGPARQPAEVRYDDRAPIAPAAAPAMDFAFVLDPLPLLKAYKDTSIAMMRAVAARGHRVFALEQRGHLLARRRDARARACRSSFTPTTTPGTRQATPEDRALRTSPRC